MYVCLPLRQMNNTTSCRLLHYGCSLSARRGLLEEVGRSLLRVTESEVLCKEHGLVNLHNTLLINPK